MSRGWTLTGSFMYTPVSGSTSLSGGKSGSYMEDQSCMLTGSERSLRSGSFSGFSEGSYTPGSGDTLSST